MGLGIWSMHYIGMLAFTLPIPVLYDLPTVAALARRGDASRRAWRCSSSAAPGSAC